MNIIVTLMKQNKGDRLMFKRNLSLVIAAMLGAVSVSYTHLTLPTNSLV